MGVAKEARVYALALRPLGRQPRGLWLCAVGGELGRSLEQGATYGLGEGGARGCGEGVAQHGG